MLIDDLHKLGYKFLWNKIEIIINFLDVKTIWQTTASRMRIMNPTLNTKW